MPSFLPFACSALLGWVAQHPSTASTIDLTNDNHGLPENVVDRPAAPVSGPGQTIGANVAAYGGSPAEQALLLHHLRAMWARYDVTIEPGAGTVANIRFVPGGGGGRAPQGCSGPISGAPDATAYHQAGDAFGELLAAAVASHEVAHTQGLLHVGDPTAIMHHHVTEDSVRFSQVDLPIMDGTCGGGGVQNSDRELLELFGPAPVDDAPPTVRIVSPHDGERIPVSTSFVVDAEASDARGVARVSFLRDDIPLQEALIEPYQFQQWGLSDGTYTFVAVAEDFLGNQAVSDPVTVIVGEGGSDGDTSASGGTDDGAGGGETMGSDGSSDSDGTWGSGPGWGSTATTAGGDEPGGCGCAGGSRGLPSLALILLGFWRRRRNEPRRAEPACSDRAPF